MNCRNRLLTNGFRCIVRNQHTQSSAETTVDFVGPPDAISRLRPLVFSSNKELTLAESAFRKEWQQVYDCNHQYWKQHNLKFAKERTSYMSELMTIKGFHSPSQVSPEDMSTFYENFMNHNQTMLREYNRSWYKRNFRLLILAVKAKMSKI